MNVSRNPSTSFLVGENHAEPDVVIGFSRRVTDLGSVRATSGIDVGPDIRRPGLHEM